MRQRKMKTKPTKQCPMENCWEQIPVRRHLCSACTSWWHRLQIKDERELASYLQRLGRFSGRFTRARGALRRSRRSAAA